MNLRKPYSSVIKIARSTRETMYNRQLSPVFVPKVKSKPVSRIQRQIQEAQERKYPFFPEPVEKVYDRCYLNDTAMPVLYESAQDGTLLTNIAIIYSMYGHSEIRKEVFDSVMSRMTNFLNPKALIFICEGQYDNVWDFEKYKDVPGVVYYPYQLNPETQDGIWMKEGLWNYAAHRLMEDVTYDDVQYFLFLDADIIPYESNYIAKVLNTLKTYPIAAPFAVGYYSNQEDRKHEIFTSVEYGYRKKTQFYKHPGFGFAMTRDFYENRVKYFESAHGGDTIFWRRVYGKRYVIPRRHDIVSVDRITEQGMIPKPAVGYVDALFVHIHHSARLVDYYLSSATAYRLCCTTLDDLWKLDAYGVPFDAGTTKSQIFKQLWSILMKANSKDKPLTIKETATVYEKLACDAYGEINDEYPLVVACVYRPYGHYTEDHVRHLKEQFEKYCQVPFRFVCFADNDVDGVETIKLNTSPEQSPGTLPQVEFFRDIWSPNASILTCDLDTVIMRPFVPHRCPTDTVYMLKEYGNKQGANVDRILWNCGMMYFRGRQFVQVYRQFERDVLDAVNWHRPAFQYIGTQEYIASILRGQGISLDDIGHHFSYSFFSKDLDRWALPDSAFMHFCGYPKPWEAAVKAAIPQANNFPPSAI